VGPDVVATATTTRVRIGIEDVVGERGRVGGGTVRRRCRG